MGVDYISYKPVYKNALNRNHEKNQISYDVVYEHLKLAKEMETDEFKVYPKLEQFKEVLENVHNEGRLYQKCYATALSIYLDEDGGMELCGNLKGRGYTIGNIYKNSFRELWQSERRKLFINKVNLNKCPAGCRLNPLNIVLWNALHPDVRRIHPNFV